MLPKKKSKKKSKGGQTSMTSKYDSSDFHLEMDD